MKGFAYLLFYLVQWVIYLIHRLLSILYGLVQFFSKPGSRLIVPIGAAGMLYLLRDLAQPLAEAYARDISPLVTSEPWLFYGLEGVVFALAICAYVILSRALAVVL